MSKISALASLTDPQATDLLVVVDDGDDTTKKMTVGALLNLIYPVGSIYTNATDDTNPGTLLGFGTWTAFATGRVLVGINGSDADFEDPEQTGGQKTVQAHTHWVSGAAWDDGNFSGHNGNTQEWGLYADAGGYSASDPDRSYGRNTKSAGSGSTNMNPYIVVYMWKRTA